MTQRSQKEWKKITRIETFDMPSDSVQLTIHSAGYTLNTTPKDIHNLRYSGNRRKIDTFWSLWEADIAVPTLDLVEYHSDQWEVIAAGFPDKAPVQSWELLDENEMTVTGVAMALQPWSNRAWIASTDNKLYLYDLDEEMVSGIQLLTEKTVGSHIQFDYNSRYLVKGETFTFTPLHARPLKEIDHYRIWFQTPSGTKYGIKDGLPVAFTSNFTVYERQFQRTVQDKVSIELTERGEYLFVLEVTFIDGEEQEERIIVKTLYKKPLTSFDLSALMTISGLEFDSDQKLWAYDQTEEKYYQIGLHYDTMLIDYDRKILYFRENYDNVDVIT
jgi:hypothetical protein